VSGTLAPMSDAATLITAVKAGDVAGVERIVAAEPELAGALEEGIPAVRLALYHRQPEALRALLAAQPPLDGLDHAALGWADDLRRDLASDEDLVTRRSPDGFTALHYACFFGGAECAGVLLAAGADPDAIAGNATRVTPLHSAAAAGDTEAARLLLDAGAAPDARQAGGFTPLHAAAQQDLGELAALLLRHGADPTLRNDKGADALGIARAQESVAVLALLGAPTA
jgi:ankyrin repeat protein